MSIRTHFCVVQCFSQLRWPVIKGGKPIWNPDPHQGFVHAFLVSAIWHALGGKRGLERPGLDVAVTALVANSPSVTSSGRGRKRGDLGRILGSPRCVQRQGVRARISVAATGASAVSCRGARLVAQQRGTLCGEAGERRRRSLRWNLGIPRWAEATYGKLLEHPAHAQPSQMVVVVPTDFGFDGQKEAVLQCFQERRRTVKVDLVSQDTLPQFRFRCLHTLQYLSSQVSNGNLRRATFGLARCPPPQRWSRSPRRNFIVDVSDSDDKFGLPCRRLSPSSSDAVHLRRPYTKRERSNG